MYLVGILIMEQFKPIPNYEGFYSINQKGEIFSIRNNRIIKPFLGKGKRTYYRIELNVKGKAKKYFVHQLIAKVFIPNVENKPFINHINGIKTDNRIENLEWCTNTENITHATLTGLYKCRTGEKHYLAKLSDSEVLEVRKEIALKASQKQLSIKYNVSIHTINHIVNRKGRYHE